MTRKGAPIIAGPQDAPTKAIQQIESLFLMIHQKLQQLFQIIERVDKFRTILNSKPGVILDHEHQKMEFIYENYVKVYSNIYDEYIVAKQSYDDNIKTFEVWMAERNELLEQAESQTNLFEQNPELCHYFAQQTIHLHEKIYGTYIHTLNALIQKLNTLNQQATHETTKKLQ